MRSDGDNRWQSLAVERHDRLVSLGDGVGALARTADTLDRLHRELGAPPAMDRWIDALDADLQQAKTIGPASTDPHLFRAALAVLGRRPAHPMLPLWHARALALVRRDDASADDALRAAKFSFEYAVRGGNFALAREIVTRARTHGADASVAMRRTWLEAEALEAWLAAEHGRARRAVAQAVALGAGYTAWEQGASAAISEGDLAEADRCLACMAASIERQRTQDIAHALFLGAARARLAGDNEGASERLDACFAQDATNVPAYFTTLWRLGRAHVDVARQRHRPAGALLGVVIARAASHYWSFLHFSALLSRAWLRMREKRTAQATLDLRKALALAQAGAYRNCDPWWDREAIDEIGRFLRDALPEHPAWSALMQGRKVAA